MTNSSSQETLSIISLILLYVRLNRIFIRLFLFLSSYHFGIMEAQRQQQDYEFERTLVRFNIL